MVGRAVKNRAKKVYYPLWTIYSIQALLQSGIPLGYVPNFAYSRQSRKKVFKLECLIYLYNSNFYTENQHFLNLVIEA